MIKGAVHSIETFGASDGPGVRFIIFLQGCRMRCRYCHNADTWAMETDSVSYYEPSELLDKAERYRSYWGEDGGITVSGGEALLQIDFLIELFEEAHKRGINTCLDTAGEPFSRDEAFMEKFSRLIELTDLFLFDIKHIDPAAHRDLTGKDNSNILDCLRFLSDNGKKIWIRHVLVPGITDDDNALEKTAEFIRSLSGVEKVEVLPYHNLGAYKWKELGIPYSLEGTMAPSADRVENARRILGAQ
ncbi:pyruvate formate-lyase-activating protein [Butyrivibrio sp. MC2013]|uniref:pyruvate formate-lyase-activating protein n=1 Tax=Butyrivibrio sp. MC2013 TaxID=1280686 RepID=UPI000419B262|nr:pyruvate formate-lyase-activating protein [Butyrivibrio sp. MC2013]